MAQLSSALLQERISRKNSLRRVCDLAIFFLLLSLLLYRYVHLGSNGYTWLLAFRCELWFAFMWLLNMNINWSPVVYKTHPERLLGRVSELPPVDMFVTTADAALEPPIITIDTVLSLLAVDYPANKLACYVSDDGGSPVTFYSLLQAAEFAKQWIPFCKKYKVEVRAPSVYFSRHSQPPRGCSTDFSGEWREMKEQYYELRQKIEEAGRNSEALLHLTREEPEFSRIERGNHPSIIKVVRENTENLPDGVPHLIYVSREKRPKIPHHHKAGAMNVLTRVSGIMTNAPFMLNVDCDMFVNNPQIILHAMCLLLGTYTETESGFVQCFQGIEGAPKDDPLGNQFIVLQETNLTGFAGIQGPFYGGTGCFHRRKIIYGQHPQNPEKNTTKLDYVNGSDKKGVARKFGQSPSFMASTNQTISGIIEKTNPPDISSCIEAAVEVADCRYELGTSWGDEVGLVYGAASEDILTGIKIHSMGWRTVVVKPNPTAFLCCAPTSFATFMLQQKRWATGFLETFFHKHSPVLGTLTKKLKVRQCIAYLVILLWAARSVPELCYSLLSAYCLLCGTSFLPKITEPAVIIPITLFLLYQLYTLVEFIASGQSVRAWWNNERMRRITSATSWLYGLLSVLLKLVGLSETLFELTRKEKNDSDEDSNGNAVKWTFDSSPLFVSGTALVLVHIGALLVALSRVMVGEDVLGTQPGELFCSVWVVVSFLPFVKGFFRGGNYGIPWSVLFKAAALALLFFYFSRGLKL
ncbi:cellulose synthase-like protein H1 isoform X1 [Aristolochia californica]|uniref:cellulose synthase-like protein H1 isoform X1 n=1 Tax=Aristolochia californica TaxID=171875 RepID=UPI0035D96CD5